MQTKAERADYTNISENWHKRDLNSVSEKERQYLSHSLACVDVHVGARTSCRTTFVCALTPGEYTQEHTRVSPIVCRRPPLSFSLSSLMSHESKLT